MAFVERLIKDGSEDQISLDLIKQWVKVEHDLDNEIFTSLREVAVNEAYNFTQYDFEHIDGDSGELVNEPIPFNVKMACIMTIAYLYENRGDEGSDLPLNCVRLLTPYKRLVGL